MSEFNYKIIAPMYEIEPVNRYKDSYTTVAIKVFSINHQREELTILVIDENNNYVSWNDYKKNISLRYKSNVPLSLEKSIDIITKFNNYATASKLLLNDYIENMSK